MCLSQLSHFKEQSLSPLWAFWLLKEEKTDSLETCIVFWQIMVECHVLSNSAWHTKARSCVEVHTTLVITSAGIQNISEAKKKKKRKRKTTWKLCCCIAALKQIHVKSSCIVLLHCTFRKSRPHHSFTIHLFDKYYIWAWTIDNYFPPCTIKKEASEPQHCPHSDLLFILLQQVSTVYGTHSWDPVNTVILALCSLQAIQQVLTFHWIKATCVCLLYASLEMNYMQWIQNQPANNHRVYTTGCRVKYITHHLLFTTRDRLVYIKN